MMRIAVIGRPGSRRTQLADLIASELGVPVLTNIEDLLALAPTSRSYVTNGIPANAADLRRLAESPTPAIDHAVLLLTDPPPHLEDPGLDEVRDLLGASGHLVEIDATASPHKALALTFEALKIRI